MKKAGRAEQEGRATAQTAESAPSSGQDASFPLAPAALPSPPASPPAPGARPPPPPALSPGRPRGRRGKAGLTRSVRPGRRRGPGGRGHAPGVPLVGLPQVILEAHLPGFAAAPEPPQSAGGAPQEAPALPRERGQVVHAAAGQGPRRPTLPTEEPLRARPPGHDSGAGAPPPSQGAGRRRGCPELGSGADHPETARRGSRSRTKVLKVFLIASRCRVRQNFASKGVMIFLERTQSRTAGGF